MKEENKEAVAMFRYGLIAEFIHAELARGEQKARMAVVSARPYFVAWQQEPIKVTVPRLKRWLSAYRRHGLKGLMDKVRKDKGTCRSIDALLQAKILSYKRADRQLSIPELIRSLEDSDEAPRGVLKSSSVHRLLQVHHLSGRPGLDKGCKPQRLQFRFEFPHDMWFGDVMHGRIEVVCKKVYLVSYLDSASRIILHSEWRFDECALTILCVFRQAVSTRGIPRRLYVDHGSAYIDSRLTRTCAHLGTQHLLAPVRDGAAKAPIERWHLRVRRQFERHLKPEDLVDLATLNSLYWRWLSSTYHRVPHSGLGGDSPWQRYLDLLPKTQHRRVEPDFDWEGIWRTREIRTVRRDGTVQLMGHTLEVPPTVHRKKVQLRFMAEALPKGVEVWIDDELIGPASPVDPIANTTRRRWRPKTEKEPTGLKGLDPLARARKTWTPKGDDDEGENS